MLINIQGLDTSDMLEIFHHLGHVQGVMGIADVVVEPRPECYKECHDYLDRVIRLLLDHIEVDHDEKEKRVPNETSLRTER